jgi:hypothetical protein
MSSTKQRNAVPYEEWNVEADGDFTWADFDTSASVGFG